MNEQDTPDPVDKILGDYHPPAPALRAKAWADHPERERIEKLWQERDENGDRLWEQWHHDDPGDPDWVELWLEPVDKFDLTRSPERIGHWHRKQDADKIAEAQANAAAEHPDDDPDKPDGPAPSYRSNVVVDALLGAPLDSPEFTNAARHATRADLAEFERQLDVTVDAFEERRDWLRAQLDELDPPQG